MKRRDNLLTEPLPRQRIGDEFALPVAIKAFRQMLQRAAAAFAKMGAWRRRPVRALFDQRFYLTALAAIGDAREIARRGTGYENFSVVDDRHAVAAGADLNDPRLCFFQRRRCRPARPSLSSSRQ